MLIANGIELITEDGCVFKNGKQYFPVPNKEGYLVLSLYDLDENGNKIKIPSKKRWGNSEKIYDSYNYKASPVGLHRAMWAWIHGVVEDGYVIDHINNQHEHIEDYHISNLQKISQRENVMKEREASIKEVPCKLDRPLSYYEDKLAHYEDLYQKAVDEGDQEEAHKQRSNTYNQRAKIRYWLSHKEEAEKLIAEKEAAQAAKKVHSDIYRAKAQTIKLLKEVISKKRAAYKEALELNGDKDETTLELKAEWKRARRELNEFEWATRDANSGSLAKYINIFTKRALLDF